MSFHNLKFTAYFNGALLFYSIIQMLFSSLVMSMIPFISREESHGMFRVKSLFTDFSRFLIFYVILLLLFVLLFVLNIWNSLFYYVGLQSYLPSVPVFLGLLIAVPFNLIWSIYSGVLQGRGYTRQILKICGYSILLCDTSKLTSISAVLMAIS